MKFLQFVGASVRIALTGSKRYYAWLLACLTVTFVGFYYYAYQLEHGLIITGMRDQVSWGSYIANFTFFVGVAAAAVMIVIPAYLYHVTEFKPVTLLGEMLAASALIMCIAFVMIDMGRPDRVWHLLPIIGKPNFPVSLLTWDVIVLSGYLCINLFIPGYMLYSVYHHQEASKKILLPFTYLSMPWAVSIHTVTAFLYCGLVSRPVWNTALMAPRFLATAFAAGPALIIIIIQIVRKYTPYGSPGAQFEIRNETIYKIANIVVVALLISLFFTFSELFTIFYSAGAHKAAMAYLYLGFDGHPSVLTPFIWGSLVMNVVAAIILLIPRLRKNLLTLNLACCLLFVGIWVEKGMGTVLPAFIPSPLGEIWEYWPSNPEALISLGVWGLGALVFTMLAKIAIQIETGAVSR
ncbi:MAG: polysulfide reductase [Nitrospirae bacterium CG18_big_fil_WC_8_21_14_2_50_70_55]|nr:polysulfide reductase NrfD [Deltaproteobacteria bacterium]OIP65961.1 MAG: polysulfide reductase [Nitrospirae bacterium CG2_30_70_394]PIQ06773.1 MAG: polysulfide reductase [Nitrospirae bacterium CG18_big_fil_WC_8_21_14_2_50_70_55]PIU80022.1 MAG: polysulfide reductase [Nitrospirae bacterium CG06_land_8_20_14_3_00_70_43]PIW83260.1 MAG: polysulfide reductase [Nitrospirae bacterium CG_4_8_14_3_um_filter_70_85]PIX82573.1 MAG: polysulfide reductase [Nitrospirae bacterium CG_4_10_14_3_um_filter_70_